MKKTAYLLAGLTVLLGVFLGGCGTVTGQAPTPIPTIMLDSGAPSAPASSGKVSVGSVTASGTVAPAQSAVIASPLSGSLVEIDVARGDKVTQGQVLARLAGSEALTAAASAAEYEVLTAQKALDDLHRDAPIKLAEAQLRLAKARDAYDEAVKRRGWKEYRVGSDTQIDLARSDLILAKDNLEKAEDAYGWVSDREDDNLEKAGALSALSAARIAYQRAEANLNYLISMPDEFEVAKVEAEMQLAKAEMDAAQAAYDRLKDGIDPSELSLAEARLENANARLSASQAALADLEIKAPFAGTVVELMLYAGEWALPGSPVLRLADLDNLQVETTDLSERDMGAVTVGSAVRVYVKALNLEVTGVVSEIANLADTLGGDVVYATIIKLDEQPEGLRAGMSVEVTFGD